jgi:hypothetical protein
MVAPTGPVWMKSAPGFDFVGPKRGRFCRLTHPNGHEVICTEWPGTLLSMLKAGVLVGKALAEAQRLAAQEEIHHL